MPRRAASPTASSSRPSASPAGSSPSSPRSPSSRWCCATLSTGRSPTAYDLSRNFLGILIFWGIAVTGFRGDHITVDLLWGALPPPGRRGLDVVGTLFTLFCMAVFTWAMGSK